MQERCNSIANALELRLSCTNPWIYALCSCMWYYCLYPMEDPPAYEVWNIWCYWPRVVSSPLPRDSCVWSMRHMVLLAQSGVLTIAKGFLRMKDETYGVTGPEWCPHHCQGIPAYEVWDIWCYWPRVVSSPSPRDSISISEMWGKGVLSSDWSHHRHKKNME